MCGIFGWQWRTTKRDKGRRAALAVALAVHNDGRGGKGWGAFTPADGRVYKGTRTMTHVLGNGLPSWIQSPFVLAHTRFPSTGDVKVENSHPFRVGKITGAHNGVVNNHEALNKKHRRRFEVDSTHIFAHLDEGRPLSEIEGYGAVWYHDAATGTASLVRLRRGELAVVEFKDGLAFSSDEFHLSKALEAAGYRFNEYKEWKPDEGVAYVLYEGQAYETSVKHDLTAPAVHRGWEAGLTKHKIQSPQAKATEETVQDEDVWEAYLTERYGYVQELEDLISEAEDAWEVSHG